MPGTGHADSATAIDGRHAILSLNLRVVLAGLPIRMAMATTVARAAAILAAPPILAQSSISPPAYALINSRTSQKSNPILYLLRHGLRLQSWLPVRIVRKCHGQTNIHAQLRLRAHASVGMRDRPDRPGSSPRHRFSVRLSVYAQRLRAIRRIEL